MLGCLLTNTYDLGGTEERLLLSLEKARPPKASCASHTLPHKPTNRERAAPRRKDTEERAEPRSALTASLPCCNFLHTLWQNTLKRVIIT